MIYFCKRGTDGNIVSVGWSRKDTSVPEGLEKMTKKEYEAWEAEQTAHQEPEEQEEAVPSAMEQMRADIDFLAALQGVTL